MSKQFIRESGRRVDSLQRQLEKLKEGLLRGELPSAPEYREVLRDIRVESQSLQTCLNERVFILQDGRVLLREHYEALREFSDSNGWDLEIAAKAFTVQEGSIVEGKLKDCSTLKGLAGLTSLRQLTISSPELSSLEGVPTESLEVLTVSNCSLSGDLSALRLAQQLRTLSISSNTGSVSLSGIPAESLQEIRANRCGLIGDLSALSEAEGLRSIDVSRNEGLVSLSGVPVKSLEMICAKECSLVGDLSALSEAEGLKSVDISGNKALVSLSGTPTGSLEILKVSRCGLTGDLSALNTADRLKKLYVSGNRCLISLQGIATASLEEVDADSCGLTGDLSALSTAERLEVVDISDNNGIVSVKEVSAQALRWLMVPCREELLDGLDASVQRIIRNNWDYQSELLRRLDRM